jgi:putative ABC transport system substrate-binding protein
MPGHGEGAATGLAAQAQVELTRPPLVDRRAFVAGVVVVLASPLAAMAQSIARSARVGFLSIDDQPQYLEAFLQELRERGYAAGRNLLLEYRGAERRPERFPALVAELVALNVDVIVTAGGTAAAMAAKQATRTIPIVFTAVGEPVADGLVASLARPGGNLTGTSLVFQLVDKLLELLKEAVPEVSRVALLLKHDAAPDRTIKQYVKSAEDATRALGLRLQVVYAGGPEDFERAFADMTRARTGAVAVMATPVFQSARQRLADVALKHRLPTVFSMSDYTHAGGLMSYGPDRLDLFRRAAIYVDKLLKGASPGELPVEQPTKFELAINLKTARALGLKIRPSLLQRADQVIE